MRARDYFPLGIAIGTAFCNRQQETQLLKDNIHQGKHTLLIASRRYGKSSLALHALKLSGCPYAEIDFYMATTEKTVENYLLEGIVDLIGKSLGPADKLLTSIKRFVRNLKPRIDISTSVFKLELSPEVNSDPASNIKEALLLLEKLLSEKQQSAALFLDEFQNIGVIAQGKGIEAAIRHVAQKTKYLTIIFSGSNRKLLRAMFEDETRPLYKLCWQTPVKRISAVHYHQHLQKAAKAAWKKPLEETTINLILSLTERHPFYLNKLCDKLWAYYHKTSPTLSEIDEVWQAILAEEKSDAIREISLLPLGQKNVLFAIATNNNLQLTSKKMMLSLAMTSSSIISALNSLEEKDLIEKEEDHYQIISPVIKFYATKK